MLFLRIQFICMAKRDFAIHLITLHNTLEYMQIAIIQNEVADFVKINICDILKNFGHDCTVLNVARIFASSKELGQHVWKSLSALTFLPGRDLADAV